MQNIKLDLEKKVSFDEMPFLVAQMQRQIKHLSAENWRLKNGYYTNNEAPKKLSVNEAMLFLGYTNQTSFNKAVRTKNIPCIRLSKKKILFDAMELESYLKENSSSYKYQMILQRRDSFLNRKTA